MKKYNLLLFLCLTFVTSMATTDVIFTPGITMGNNYSLTGESDTLSSEGVCIFATSAAFARPSEYRFAKASDIIVSSTRGSIQKVVFEGKNSGEFPVNGYNLHSVVKFMDLYDFEFDDYPDDDWEYYSRYMFGNPQYYWDDNIFIWNNTGTMTITIDYIMNDDSDPYGPYYDPECPEDYQVEVSCTGIPEFYCEYNKIYVSKILVTIDTIGDILIGDVNGDGRVNIADAIALIDILLNGSSDMNENSDVNEDSCVDIADVTALIDLLLGS